MDRALFVRRNTAVATPPLVPEIRLHLATEVTPLWQASEEALARRQLPPPFWAFAWAGGQALARFLIDNPQLVEGRRLFDFGAGSGLVAIAAKKAGAADVVAADIDEFAAAAIRLNAGLNRVRIGVSTTDPLAAPTPDCSVIAAGDVCYERDLAERALAWLRRLAGCGARVLIGDPGRAYLPAQGLCERACYMVPTSRELEDRDSRETRVFEVSP